MKMQAIRYAKHRVDIDSPPETIYYAGMQASFEYLLALLDPNHFGGEKFAKVITDDAWELPWEDPFGDCEDPPVFRLR